MITVELISAHGCAKCAAAKDALKRAALETAGGAIEWRDVDVLAELDYAVDLGVLTLPAIAINGKLVFSSLPTPEQMRNEVRKAAG